MSVNIPSLPTLTQLLANTGMATKKHRMFALMAVIIALALWLHLGVYSERSEPKLTDNDLHDIYTELAEFTHGNLFGNLRMYNQVGGFRAALANDIHNFPLELRQELFRRIGEISVRTDGTVLVQVVDGRSLFGTFSFQRDHGLHLSKIEIEGVGEIPVR